MTDIVRISDWSLWQADGEILIVTAQGAGAVANSVYVAPVTPVDEDGTLLAYRRDGSAFELEGEGSFDQLSAHVWMMHRDTVGIVHAERLDRMTACVPSTGVSP